jgi:hypothetical protein
MMTTLFTRRETSSQRVLDICNAVETRAELQPAVQNAPSYAVPARTELQKLHSMYILILPHLPFQSLPGPSNC